jgi:DeoR/GlpR family transcriptional regulator of sugar metabolism
VAGIQTIFATLWTEGDEVAVVLNVVGKLAVLVDSSKVGERAGMLFSQASQIDLVITRW